MKHVGVRPEYAIERDEGKKRPTWYEFFPLGGYRIWTLKTLRSGCNRKLKEIKSVGNLIYCPFCEEWFNELQFKSTEEQNDVSVQESEEKV